MGGGGWLKSFDIIQDLQGFRESPNFSTRLSFLGFFFMSFQKLVHASLEV